MELISNKEVEIDKVWYIGEPSEIKISLCICLWNMEHLLIRSIETYCNQDLPKEFYELIIIDDNSFGDVQPILDYAIGKINLRYVRLAHSDLMRGNTIAFSHAFSIAHGEVIAETTAETMFTTNMIRKLYEPHLIYDRAFLAVKTYNLTPELQFKIDECNWREDVSNIMLLDGFFNDWTLNNFKTVHFGTHQTCSIKKKVFYEIMPNGFPLYSDYGSDDPRYSGVRSQKGIKDITLMQPMAFHQWHPSWHFWGTKGFAPNCNKFGHSMRNVYDDKSGHVPEGGTCMIWDGGSHEQYSQAEIDDQSTWDERVKATGCKVDLYQFMKKPITSNIVL